MHIALLKGQYQRWGVEELARRQVLALAHKQPFNPDWFPGYISRRGCLDEVFVKAMGRDDALHPLLYAFWPASAAGPELTPPPSWGGVEPFNHPHTPPCDWTMLVGRLAQ